MCNKKIIFIVTQNIKTYVYCIYKEQSMKKITTIILNFLLIPIIGICQCPIVADYEFTGNANDASSYNIPATDYGATLAPDRFGNANNAYYFNGSSYIQADTNNRGVVSLVTLSAWVNTTTGVMIAEKYNYAEDAGYYIAVYENKAQVAGRDGSGNFYSVLSQNSVADGQWHLITGVYRGTQWEIWVDGVLEGTLTTGHSTGTLSSSEPLTIGYNADGSLSGGTLYYFTGLIDEVKIWNCALDSATIASAYSKPCALVADYELDGNSVDSSFNNITATDYGATLAPDRFGNANSAYRFNGVNNYIYCDTNNRGITSSVTVSAWIQTTAANNGNFIVGKYNWSEDNGYIMAIYNNKAQFEGRDGSGFFQTTGGSKTTVTDGQWHLVTGVVRNGVWEIWVDGVLENDSVSGTSNPQLANTQPLVIGYYSENQSSYYQGEIDQVKIWNCALDSVTIASAYSKPPVLCPIVADYEFTGNTNDSSSYHITATDYGATLAPDRFGNPNSAYYFNGNSYIQADTVNRGVVSLVTLSAWVNTTTGVMIAEKYSYAEDAGYYIAVYENKAQVAGRDGSGNFYSVLSQNSVTDGQWHLITGVYRGTQWEIWVDGVLEGTLTTGHSTGILSSSEPLTIGYNADGSLSGGTLYYFTGLIDEVKIWNCALDSATIALMYSPPTQITGITSVSSTEGQIIVFPSPTSDVLNIKGNTQGVIEIVIADYTGRSVLDVPFNSQIPVNNLQTGVYVILFKGVGGSVLESLKFVKQ